MRRRNGGKLEIAPFGPLGGSAWRPGSADHDGKSGGGRALDAAMYDVFWARCATFVRRRLMVVALS